MIYYYIPDFFYHKNINLKLLELLKSNPEMFYNDFKIGAVFGNFPNCIWNGGSVSFGRTILTQEQIAISLAYNMYNIPLRLTMTNPTIDEFDIYDKYSNYIMQNLNNGFNQVLISNPKLEKYIREKYPNYPIIRSILASENKHYDDSDKYFMSVLRKHKNNDIEFLKSIKNKDKIEILVNETCNENCPRAYSHYLDFAKKQKFENGINTECSYNREFKFKHFLSHPLCITRDKIKEVYEPMGFKHFKISGRKTFSDIILYYAHYMVKPEYKDDFIAMMIPASLQDLKESCH